MKILGDAINTSQDIRDIDVIYDVTFKGEFTELDIATMRGSAMKPTFEVHLPLVDTRRLRDILLEQDTTAPVPDSGYLGLGVGIVGANTINIIATVEKSITGNTVFRMGKLRVKPKGWEQVAHVVITPDERRELIGLLAGQLGIAS